MTIGLADAVTFRPDGNTARALSILTEDGYAGAVRGSRLRSHYATKRRRWLVSD
ncbi:hypothetical protein [Gordonia sp. SL306]|uniref:hypothetical protein n=1 Tax=Gordonia sp. SL306 TaxID=2995145 RepID=UPI0022710554|nr:hypothetical protein [Gordonia sp. SL306]WAC55572.1 hypothetical protein OVA31_23840 [Gordonia sp. SL306]